MKRLIWTIIFCTFLASPAQALVEAKVFNTLKLTASPIDIASSGDGTWTFVLTEGGRLHIFSADGQLNDIIEVEPTADHIFVSGKRGNKLYVSSSSTKNVQLLTLSFAASIDTTGSPFLGNPDAPVTIVLFSDFQCPYCAKMEPLIGRVLETYPDTVKIVFKHFPLRNHQYASLAALAAIAAQQQGKFWEFHDRIFAAQKELNQQKILDIAKSLGLDIRKFTSDIGKSSVKDQLTKDIRDGKSAGVRGTPTLFINGREPTKPTFETIQQMIEAELALKAGKR